eukprot:TRINITY_DN15058_c0_g1_i1.p1 TRINITY_DN15058_c0_g1~~TRINITY_DN15058_c0_g1_i1.p1  ORF type:complete len:1261 (-),score=433.54 TRINITY_DN15058_c0_g1_i1:71-3853(-)
MLSATSCSVRVIVRFRPINEREKTEKIDPKSAFTLTFSPDKTGIEVKGGPQGQTNSFNFDRVFDSNAAQPTIFEDAASATVKDVLQGYNGTIFAYGQTGSGKTFTMFGPDRNDLQLRGVIPRTASAIFDHINSDTSGTQYTIKCSFLEIYREQVRDLLNPKNSNMRVRESPTRGVWVEDLTEEYISSENDIMDLISIGETARTVSFTMMNAASSRSHSLFVVMIEQKNPDDGSVKVGRLNLADLAGSEKIAKTGAEKTTVEEAKKINQSLSALGNCISALSKGKGTHVPFRDSKLTFVLRESLGGNTKTTLLAGCSPHSFNMEETLSTLRFAQRAKMIKTNVAVNRQLSVAELDNLVAQLKSELLALKAYVRKLEIQLGTRKPDDGEGADDSEVGEYNPLELAQTKVQYQQLKDASDAKIAELTETQSENQEAIATLEAKLQLLESKATGGVGSIPDEEVQQMRLQLRTAEQRVIEQTAQIEDSAKQIRSLEEIAEEQEVELDSLKRHKKTADEEAEANRKRMSELSEANARLSSGEQAAQRRLTELQTQLTDLTALQSELEAELDSYQSGGKVSGAASAAVDEQVAQVKAQMEKKVAAATARADQVTQRNEALLTELEQAAAAQIAAKAQQQAIIDQLQSQIKQFTEDATVQERIANDLRARLSERDAELRSKADQADTLSRELSVEVQRSVARKTIMSQQETRIRDLETELSVIQQHGGVSAFSGGPTDAMSLQRENQKLMKEMAELRTLHSESMSKLREQLKQQPTRAAQVVRPVGGGQRGGVLEAYRAKPELMTLLNADMQGWLTKQGGAIKTWKKRWFLLKGPQLFYYKTQKDHEPVGTILLRGATVKSGVDKEAGRKFAFTVTPLNDRTFFVHAETEDELTEWIAALQIATGQALTKGAAGPAPKDGEAGRNPLFKETAKSMAEKTKPHPVFGMPVSPVGIDGIVLPCIRVLESSSMDEEGLFRLSADPSAIQQVCAFLEAGQSDLSNMAGEPHAIACALKKYIRDESMDPLLTYDLYDEVVSLADVSDEMARVNRLREALKSLPSQNGALLRYLLAFLQNVASQSASNKMNPQNLAIVFAPSMLRTANDDLQREAADTKRTQTVIAELIEKQDELLDTSVLSEWRKKIGAFAEMANQQPQYTGWLTKQGGSIKTWKKRWCVLKDNELTYFKTDKPGQAAQGSILLDGYTAEDDEGKAKHPHCLRLYHPIQRTFFLCALTENAKQDWLRILRKAANWHSHFGPAAQKMLQEQLD